jgi:hypothetical protein
MKLLEYEFSEEFFIALECYVLDAVRMHPNQSELARGVESKIWRLREGRKEAREFARGLSQRTQVLQEYDWWWKTPSKEIEAWLDTPIESLGLSTRTMNGIKRGRPFSMIPSFMWDDDTESDLIKSMITVGDVLGQTRSELLSLRNFGNKSLKDLLARLEEKGFPLPAGEEK